MSGRDVQSVPTIMRAAARTLFAAIAIFCCATTSFADDAVFATGEFADRLARELGAIATDQDDVTFDARSPSSVESQNVRTASGQPVSYDPGLVEGEPARGFDSVPEEVPRPGSPSAVPFGGPSAGNIGYDGTDPDACPPGFGFGGRKPRPAELGLRPRHKGLGRPLTRSSWMYRPMYVGWYLGGIWGDELRDGEVDADGGFLTGYRLGSDWNYFLGWETAFQFGSMDVSDLNAAQLAAQFPNQNFNFPGRSVEYLSWDIALMYYFWGDVLWRPFLTVGMGVADFDFQNLQGTRFAAEVFKLPIGGGLKYRYNERFALRLDVIDEIAFGNGEELQNMHNVSFTAGVEYHFGGRKRSYWPWNPSRSLW